MFFVSGDFWDFHGAGIFFGGIFTMLETSRIFAVLETSPGDFNGA